MVFMNRTSHCMAAKTCRNIASLAQTAVTYSNAYTPGYCDEVMGMPGLPARQPHRSKSMRSALFA
jgi:hypothetical protein